MAKAGKKKAQRQEQPKRKRRDPRQGDSSVGLPGVMAIERERDYLAAYRYQDATTRVRGA